MANDLILTERRDGVVCLTLNRPEVLNAIDLDLRTRLAEHLSGLAEDESVRVIVITGAGRAFSAGGDIRLMQRLHEKGSGFEGFRPVVEKGREVVNILRGIGKPVLASVNGPAAGAGLMLALACDIRLVSDRATFGATFCRIGIHPDWGATHLLPNLVGPAKALELIFTGEMIDAEEALRIGLVNRVVPHEHLQKETEALADQLSQSPQPAMSLAKTGVYRGLWSSLDEAMAYEVEAQQACWESEDCQEGIRAFIEKREPRFGGSDGGR